MTRRVQPDDDVFRWRSVWLGPQTTSLPWAARYSAYGTGFAIFFAILAIEAVLPVLHIGVPPVWEVCITVLLTSLLMSAVDHDKSVAAVLSNTRHALGHRADPAPPEHYVLRARTIKRHTNRDPNEPHHHPRRAH